jgi:hypothetical protein
MKPLYILLVFCLVFAGCAATNQATKKEVTTKVYGQVMAGESVYVPKANISLSCGVKGGTNAIADDHGHYLAEVNCPLGGIVEVTARSGPQEICILPETCMPFAGGKTTGSGNISSAGYAKIDLVIN